MPLLLPFPFADWSFLRLRNCLQCSKKLNIQILREKCTKIEELTSPVPEFVPVMLCDGSVVGRVSTSAFGRVRVTVNVSPSAVVGVNIGIGVSKLSMSIASGWAFKVACSFVRSRRTFGICCSL